MPARKRGPGSSGCSVQDSPAALAEGRLTRRPGEGKLAREEALVPADLLPCVGLLLLAKGLRMAAEPGRGELPSVSSEPAPASGFSPWSSLVCSHRHSVSGTRCRLIAALSCLSIRRCRLSPSSTFVDSSV